jgi:hypothetical protein
MLSAHPDIATTSEPWLLLPLVTMTQDTPSLACYSHRTASQGVVDFASKLPGGLMTFQQCLADFVRTLYGKQCASGERYFLDKTPRYFWIIDEIADLFPEARFIFLFRHPLQVMASILDTWANGRLRQVERYRLDIQSGIPKLSLASQRYAERAFCLHYEELVQSPQTQLARICDFLEIPVHMEVIEHIAESQVPGRFGDPTGPLRYETISNASLEKWHVTLASPYRKWLIKRWLGATPPKLRTPHTVDGSDPLKLLEKLPTNWRSWLAVPRDLYDHGRSVHNRLSRDIRLRCPRAKAALHTGNQDS